MKKWIAIGAVLVFAVAGLAIAAQQGWGPGWRGGFQGLEARSMGQGIMTFLDSRQVRSELNLTDDQVARLRQLVTDTEKANIETRAKIAVEGIDLRQLLTPDKPDEAAVMKKVQQIVDLRGQVMKTNVHALLEAKTILTPEQQDMIRQFIQRRLTGRGWRQNRGRNWMGGPQGGTMRRQPGTPPSPPSAPTPPSPPSH